jgi:hypothetical protein
LKKRATIKTNKPFNMKKTIKGISSLLAILALTFVACKKEDVLKPGPETPPPTPSHEIQFVVNSFLSEPTNPSTALYAVVTLTNSQNVEVVSNKKLAISFEKQYVSEKLTLAGGEYKVTKFLLQKDSTTINWATPIAGSPKATQVQKPLSVSVSLPSPTLVQVPLEVVKVETADKPESFGYPAGTFNQAPGSQPSTVKIKVKAVIGIGDLIYDSIPASLTVNTWDNNGVMTTQSMEIAAGATEVLLSKAAARYQLVLKKWGITDEMTLPRNEVEENTTYSLGGTKAAKKLKQTDNYLWVQGAYVPDAKTVYSYGANGSLDKIDFFQKRPQHSDLKRYYTDVYLYQSTGGNVVKKINRLDETNQQVAFTEFTYNNHKKVVNMHQKSYGQDTYASVEYSFSAGHGIITADYLFDNGHAMENKITIKGGNKVEDEARTSTGGAEGGKYSYDFSINPYAHMNMPDLYLSNLSKNNLTGQQKGFGGAIPSGVPYKYEYKYDTDGYPTELVKSYKSYTTGEHLYSVKTIYTY